MITKLKKRLYKLLNRSHFFYTIRFFIILIKPTAQKLRSEAYNDYNHAKDIPRIFHEENKKIQPLMKGNKLDMVIALANFIRLNYTGGKSLGFSSAQTLEIMRKGKGGVCSDYSQVFINFCILNNIRVREWGIHDTIYQNKVGHVFNEVFIPEFNKWICIDVSKGICFVNNKTGKFLSTSEIIDLQSAGNAKYIDINFFLNRTDVFTLNTEAIKNLYFNHTHLFFLVTRYKIKNFDRMMELKDYLPTPLLHLLLILKNDYYRYMLYINEKNQEIINTKIKSIFKSYQPVLQSVA